MATSAVKTRMLILPAEIYAREFDARLLQGVIAVERGWKVLVGSKALINRSIWRFQPSVYLCQTLTHKRRTMLNLLSKLGHTSFGWDEEGLVYYDRDIYLMRRVSSDTLALLQKIFTWGQQSADDVNYRARGLGMQAVPLGNPRFDMVRPELHALYAKEIAEIKERFGKFVLIDTNFSSFNPIISLHDLKQRSVSKKNIPVASEQENFQKRQSHRKIIYEHFLSDLPRFTAAHPELNFVVRAHPAENELTWIKRFEGQANVSVVREGSSVPWLIAASALIHNGCTTAVEAAIIGKTPIAYCPAISLAEESALPNPISHRARDLMELALAVRSAAAGSLEMGNSQHEILRRYVSGIKGPFASQAVMDELEDLSPKNGAWLSFLRVLMLGFARLRDVYKSGRRDHITDRYLEKVFPLITASSVQARVDEIALVLNVQRKIIVREIADNIFELDIRA